jgi:hypothetical protein
MKFAFRLQVQALAGPAQKEAIGFRAGSLHISSVAEAAERFIRDELLRKRERMFRR